MNWKEIAEAEKKERERKRLVYALGRLWGVYHANSRKGTPRDCTPIKQYRWIKGVYEEAIKEAEK